MKLRRILIVSIVLMLTALIVSVLSLQFTHSSFPLLTFGFILMFIYLPKWIYWPFAIIHHYIIGTVFAAFISLLVLYGITLGRTSLEVRKVDVYAENIPANFEGYRIVQVSDLHLGSLLRNEKWINSLPERINTQKPDLFVFTGDLVNTYADEANGWAPLFNRISAKDGTFAVMGNHDYSLHLKNSGNSDTDSTQNAMQVKQAYQDLGFKVLSDESFIIKRGAEKIGFIGTENIGAPPFPLIGSLNKAMKGIKDIDCKILFTHDPSIWEDMVVDTTDILLTLSGHSHAMQMGFDHFGIKISPAQLVYKYWDGTYQKNNQYLHVNRGIGYVGHPLRIGMKPEITVIVLHHKD